MTIWEQEAPDGFCEDLYCQDCAVKRDRIHAMIDAAKRAYNLAINSRGITEEQKQQIYQQAFEDALMQMSDEHNHQVAIVRQQAFIQAQTQMQQSMRRVQEQSYQRGYNAGMAAAGSVKQAPVTDFDRQKLIDEMLNECKVIAESNPNMKAGVNAVRHRIKKLKKE